MSSHSNAPDRMQGQEQGTRRTGSKLASWPFAVSTSWPGAWTAALLGATLGTVLSATLLLGWGLPSAIDRHAASRPSLSRLGTLDIAALYQAKEAQVTAALLRSDASPTERALALQEAADFGLRLAERLALLPQECDCLVLNQAAVIGAGPELTVTDLTPSVRAALGLHTPVNRP